MVEHYYVKKPKVKYREYLIEANLRGIDLRFKSASGVFSAKKIDRGSRVLIKKMQIPKKGKILDLGCGYGVLGIVAAKLSPAAEIILTDINKRACQLSAKNLKLNNVKNAEVRQGCFYEAVKDECFDVILLNPPITAGKKICFRMIDEAPKHLKSGGNIQIVARRRKGGASLFEEMKKAFKKTDVLAKSGGFWVYKGVKV